MKLNLSLMVQVVLMLLEQERVLEPGQELELVKEVLAKVLQQEMEQQQAQELELVLAQAMKRKKKLVLQVLVQQLLQQRQLLLLLVKKVNITQQLMTLRYGLQLLQSKSPTKL